MGRRKFRAGSLLLRKKAAATRHQDVFLDLDAVRVILQTLELTLTRSNSDVAHFQEKEWAVLKGFLSAEELSSFFRAFNRLLLLKAGKTQGELKPFDNRVDPDLLVDLFKTDPAGLYAEYQFLKHLQSLQKMQLGGKVRRALPETLPGHRHDQYLPRAPERGSFSSAKKSHSSTGTRIASISRFAGLHRVLDPLRRPDKDGAIDLPDGLHLDGLRRAKMLDPLNENKNGSKTLSIDHDTEFSKYASSIPSLDVGHMLVFSSLTVHRSVPQKTEPLRVMTQFRGATSTMRPRSKEGGPVGSSRDAPLTWTTRNMSIEAARVPLTAPVPDYPNSSGRFPDP